MAKSAVGSRVNAKPLVLLVDNKCGERDLLEAKLAADLPEFALHVHSDEEAALQELKSPDLCLVVIHERISAYNGLAFISRVRALHPKLPVILVTQHEKLRHWAYESGVTRFVLEGQPDGVHQAVRSVLADVVRLDA